MSAVQLKELDLETRSARGDHLSLRLWLRLLTCTQLVEKRIRAGLREEFETTLPRFDLLAQLQRSPDGLKMNQLSARMMVTKGNVTGIVKALELEGLIERTAIAGDRRASKISLTKTGRELFAQMASAHEGWIVESFAVLDRSTQQMMQDGLGLVKEKIKKGEK